MALAAPGQTAPQYVNSIVIPGKTLDQSGGTGVNTGRFGAFSDLYYIPAKNEWLGLADRGPGGGTISYETRVNRFSLDVNKTTGTISNFQIKQTVLFRNSGISFNGLAPNLLRPSPGVAVYAAACARPRRRSTAEAQHPGVTPGRGAQVPVAWALFN